ncbi:DUF234 domain-containing protein [Bacillaceae bacterium Marseille-Q3522]|nr:DUF234 domain-containing protein [Bacillaceae bacterium Marseille-Q3522]
MIEIILSYRHIAYVYEEICIEKMWQLNAEKKLPFLFDKCGRRWNNHTEIDIVAFESTGENILFGECKYTNEPMDVDIFYQLMKKRRLPGKMMSVVNTLSFLVSTDIRSS